MVDAMDTPALLCFVCGVPCGKVLTVARAVVFTSDGNYGSTVFDPLDRTSLALAVCDGCVVAGKSRLVGYRRMEPRPHTVYFSADIALYGEPAEPDGPRGPVPTEPGAEGANGPTGPRGGDQ